MTKSELILGMAEIYGTELTEPRLRGYLHVLKDITAESLALAIDDVTKDPDIRFFPVPALLLQKAKPHMNHLHNARTLAGKIMGAIKAYGYTNRQEAKDYIGDIGWRAVEMQGGWTQLCETVGPKNFNTMQAQIRDLCSSVVTAWDHIEELEPPPVKKQIKALPVEGEPIDVLGEEARKKMLAELYAKLGKEL